MNQFIIGKEVNTLIRIMNVNNLPISLGTQVVNLWKHWELHHGAPWLVARLKEYRQCLKNPKGQFSFARDSRGRWKGPMRIIQRMTEDGTRRSRIRADRCLVLYGRWEAKRVRVQDYFDYSKSVRSDGPDDFTYSLTPVDRVLEDVGGPLSIDPEDRWLADHAKGDFERTYPLSNTKCPVGGGRTLTESVCLPIDHVQGLIRDCPDLTVRHSKILSRVCNLPKDWLFRHAHGVTETMFAGGVEYIDLGSLPEAPQIVGHLSGLTKDRGLKIRFIANPNRHLQLACSRLKNVLEEFLRGLPESCVHDQESGVRWIHEKFKQGFKLWSVDLTKASDNIPLVVQAQLMYDLFPRLRDDIRLWVDISRAYWRPSCFPQGKRAEFLIRFEKGQPLGTGPSFSAFTIAHIFLLRDCCRAAAKNSRYLKRYWNSFRVIGDDVVISDREVADLYLAHLTEWGVDISVRKSLLGSDIAEFAGRTVDSFGMWRSYKASQLDVKSDPVGYVRQYGKAGLKLIPHKIRGVVEKFIALPFYGVEPWIRPEVLDNVPEESIYEAYKDKPSRPYESRMFPEHALVSRRELDVLERGDPRVGTPLLTYGNDNHPALVQHINANLVDGNTSSCLQKLESSLSRNPSPWSLVEDGNASSANKAPISFVKKVVQLLRS